MLEIKDLLLNKKERDAVWHVPNEKRLTINELLANSASLKTTLAIRDWLRGTDVELSNEDIKELDKAIKELESK